MVPKPRINLLVYHGAFAPNARGRREAVRRARAGAALGASPAPPSGGSAGVGVVAPNGSPEGDLAPSPSSAPPPAAGRTLGPGTSPGGYRRPRYYPWADLLRRTFAIDVLACPGCGGRLRLLATIAHPPAIAKILRHLGLPIEVPVPAPARQLAW